MCKPSQKIMGLGGPNSLCPVLAHIEPRRRERQVLGLVARDLLDYSRFCFYAPRAQTGGGGVGWGGRRLNETERCPSPPNLFWVGAHFPVTNLCASSSFEKNKLGVGTRRVYRDVEPKKGVTPKQIPQHGWFWVPCHVEGRISLQVNGSSYCAAVFAFVGMLFLLCQLCVAGHEKGGDTRNTGGEPETRTPWVEIVLLSEYLSRNDKLLRTKITRCVPKSNITVGQCWSATWIESNQDQLEQAPTGDKLHIQMGGSW